MKCFVYKNIILNNKHTEKGIVIRMSGSDKTKVFARNMLRKIVCDCDIGKI